MIQIFFPVMFPNKNGYHFFSLTFFNKIPSLSGIQRTFIAFRAAFPHIRKSDMDDYVYSFKQKRSGNKPRLY